MKELPDLAIERLMKEKGAERVSEDAKKEMRKILQEHLYNLSTKAAKVTNHADRKTINSGDIYIAKE